MAQLAKLATCVPAFKMFIKRYAYLLFNVKISFFYFFQRKYNLLGYRDLFPIDGGKLKEQPTHSIIPTTPHSACNLLLSVMVGVQGTILRRGAMHHSSHSQSQSQSHKGQGRVRICKVCGKESNKGPHWGKSHHWDLHSVWSLWKIMQIKKWFG